MRDDLKARISRLAALYPGLRVDYHPKYNRFTVFHSCTPKWREVKECDLERAALQLSTCTFMDDTKKATNTDIIDIEGIGTVDITKLSFLGVAVINGDLMRFETIIDGVSRLWVKPEDTYTSLLTAMRGRP